MAAAAAGGRCRAAAGAARRMRGWKGSPGKRRLAQAQRVWRVVAPRAPVQQQQLLQHGLERSRGGGSEAHDEPVAVETRFVARSEGGADDDGHERGVGEPRLAPAHDEEREDGGEERGRGADLGGGRVGFGVG